MFCWLSQLDLAWRFAAELPIDKNINIQEMNKRRLYAKTKTFSIFKHMFLSIVYKLEMEYWVLHCGTDGYLYLLFQRQMLKLAAYLSILIFLCSAFMNMSGDDGATDQDQQFIFKMMLSNRGLSGNRSWVQLGLVAVITFLAIYFVGQTR